MVNCILLYMQNDEAHRKEYIFIYKMLIIFLKESICYLLSMPSILHYVQNPYSNVFYMS